MTGLELVPMITTLLTLVPADVWKGAGGEVIGGISADILKALYGKVSGERRTFFQGRAVRKRLLVAWNRSLLATVRLLMPQANDELQTQTITLFSAWLKDREVSVKFAKVLEERATPLDLPALARRFLALGGASLLPLDPEAFIAAWAAAFRVAVLEDPVLKPLFEATDLEKLVKSAVEQSRLLEKIQQDGGLRNDLLSRIEAALSRGQGQATGQSREQLEALRALLKGQEATVEVAREIREAVQVVADEVRDRRTAPQRALAEYLRLLRLDCTGLALQGVDVKSSDAERTGAERLDRGLELEDVYIQLNTTERKRRAQAPGQRQRNQSDEDDLEPLSIHEDEPLSVLEGFSLRKRLVLLGAPGSGKSTFVRYVAARLAAWQLALAAEERDRLRLPGGWTDEHMARLPVVVELRDLAAWGKAHGNGGAVNRASRAEWVARLRSYLEHRCERLGASSAFVPLWENVKRGQALILFDGLDEVPSEGDRIGEIKALLEAVSSGLAATPVLVTCRVLSWEDPRWRLGRSWESLQVAPLTQDQIDDFIGRWYGCLEARGSVKGGAQKAQKLRDAVRRRDLAELAPNPLLLTVMALLHSHRSELPDARVTLYEEAVELLLQRWDSSKGEGLEPGRSLQQWLELGECRLEDLEQTLSQVAFEAHRRLGLEAAEQSGTTADIPRRDLRDALQDMAPQQSREWAEAGLGLMQDRSGLLVENPTGIFRFPHRTFQEYLAARHLLSLEQTPEETRGLADQGQFWWEVLRLAVARSRLVNTSRLGVEIIGSLVEDLDALPSSAAGWRRIWLAGSCLTELKGPRAQESLTGHLRKAVVRQLVALLDLGALPAAERAEAGRVLGELGDPRLGLEKPERWVWVPPGTFHMGGDGDYDGKPIHEVEISRGFWLGKYPVTNQEYAAFVKAGGYEAQEWWDEKGWQAREAKGWKEPDEWTNPRFNAPNQPVVGVSWWEARAFSRWLRGQWKASRPSWLKAELEPRLPSEAEWEYAARGTDVREYPWGSEDPTPERANYTDIDWTTPVGIYPSGAGPFGALDQAGNVWEWCADEWFGSYDGAPSDGSAWINNKLIDNNTVRVFRGGSWVNYPDNLRGAYRSWNGAGNRNINVGFRLCVGSVPAEHGLGVED